MNTSKVISLVLIFLIVMAFISIISVTAQEEEPTEEPGVTTTQPTLPTSRGAIDLSQITEDLSNGQFWIPVLWAILVGAVGGLVSELIGLNGMIELPWAGAHNAELPAYVSSTSKLLDFGVFARIIIGGLAAVLGVFLLAPSDSLAFIAIALVSGSAGISVFRNFQNRLAASLAINEKQRTLDNLRKANDKLEELSEAFKNLENVPSPPIVGPGTEFDLMAVLNATDEPEATRLIGSLDTSFNAFAFERQSNLREIRNLLAEAKAITNLTVSD